MSKQIAPIDALKKDLHAMQPQFKMALPAHISVEKFMRVAQTAIQTNPNLQSANRHSLFSACMKLAQQGLLPDGREAAIVTFKNKQGENIAQDMPMVAGILKKVRNSGELSSITSQLVYEKDAFKYWVDENGEQIKHEPNMFGDRGKMIGAYALAKTKDGAVYIEIMTVDQINAIKNASRSKDSGPWAGPFATEMIKKSCIRRLSKRLPMSTDLEMAVEADDNLYEPIQQTEEPPPQESKPVETKPAKKNAPKKLMAEIIETQAEEITEDEIVTEDIPI
jgi:recombination protein RecT